MATLWSILLATFLLAAVPEGETPGAATALDAAAPDTLAFSEDAALRLDSLLQAPRAEKLRSLLSRILPSQCQWDAMDPGMTHVPDTAAQGLIGRVLPSENVTPHGRVLSPCFSDGSGSDQRR